MEVWRICKQKHQNTAFSGDGGLIVSGRWHPKDFRIVYTAESLSLATLEVFVHTESDKIPLVAIRASIPDTVVIEELDSQFLPPNWQDVSSYPVLQQIGKNWLEAKRSPILKVPSSIVPVEFIYLLNPHHPDLKFDLYPPVIFKFDPRMWKSVTIEGVTTPTVLNYIESMNANDFEVASGLFADQGALQPPFEKPIVGKEAILAYMRAECQKLKLMPERGVVESLDDGFTQIKVTGKMQTPWFGASVGMNIAWRFLIDPQGKIFFVAIDLLASPQELLNLVRR